MSLAGRIAGAEARLRLLSPSLRVVEISGGLVDGVADFATYDDVLIEREASDESVDEFRRRAIALATAAGARALLFGGLPPMPMDDEGAPA
jgi:hypothetical protein